MTMLSPSNEVRLVPYLFVLTLTIFLGVQVAVAASADLYLTKGMSFADAREKLRESKWIPQAVSAKMSDGTGESSWGEAKRFRDAGILEIESCSGTGANYCFFNYKKDGRCLRVTTAGEYRPDFNSPKIFSWLVSQCGRAK